MLRYLLAALFFLHATIALAAPEIGKPAPDFNVADHTGKPAKLSGYKGKTVVLEWHNPECPFVKKHYGSGNMQALQSNARSEHGVVWIMVNSGAVGKQGHMTPEQASAFLENNKLKADHYIVDADGAIGKLYDAKTTPHMFVVDKEGNLAYMGAIDDKSSADPADIAGARNHVRAALEELAAGKPVTVASSQSYGCSVKYAD